MMFCMIWDTNETWKNMYLWFINVLIHERVKEYWWKMAAELHSVYELDNMLTKFTAEHIQCIFGCGFAWQQ